MSHKYVQPSVGIIGARGYSGEELLRLAHAHPALGDITCFAGDSGLEAQGRERIRPMAELETALPGLRCLFLAAPADVSLRIAPLALEAGVDVIDLSGAFRLKSSTSEAYPRWYGFPHGRPELVAKASYGLVPWASPAQAIATGKGRLVANPGCYATAALMALIPLLRAGAIETEGLVIDAKSGTTGAGRKADESLLFSEVAEECRPYRVGRHQHLPEIQEWAQAFGGMAIDPHFTTHLIPVRRGILVGLYARLKPGKTASDVEAAYQAAYDGYPLARIGSAERLPLLKKVQGTPCVNLGFEVVDRKLYAFSAIDNLMKGAASQAVENFNRLYDLPPVTGLGRSPAGEKGLL